MSEFSDDDTASVTTPHMLTNLLSMSSSSQASFQHQSHAHLFGQHHEILASRRNNDIFPSKSNIFGGHRGSNTLVIDDSFVHSDEDEHENVVENASLAKDESKRSSIKNEYNPPSRFHSLLRPGQEADNGNSYPTELTTAQSRPVNRRSFVIDSSNSGVAEVKLVASSVETNTDRVTPGPLTQQQLYETPVGNSNSSTNRRVVNNLDKEQFRADSSSAMPKLNLQEQVDAIDSRVQSSTQRPAISSNLRPVSRHDIGEHNIFQTSLKRLDESSRNIDILHDRPVPVPSTAANNRDNLLRKKLKRDLIRGYESLGLNIGDSLDLNAFGNLLFELNISLEYSRQLLCASYDFTASLAQHRAAVSGVDFNCCLLFLFFVYGIDTESLVGQDKELIAEVQKCRFTTKV
jgi:hypothetical protein